MFVRFQVVLKVKLSQSLTCFLLKDRDLNMLRLFRHKQPSLANHLLGAWVEWAVFRTHGEKYQGMNGVESLGNEQKKQILLI